MNASHVELLSPRELEVVGLLAEGFSLKEIAGRLELHIGTVKSHLASARRRTSSRTNIQLAVRVVPRHRLRARPERARGSTSG